MFPIQGTHDASISSHSWDNLLELISMTINYMEELSVYSFVTMAENMLYFLIFNRVNQKLGDKLSTHCNHLQTVE